MTPIAVVFSQKEQLDVGTVVATLQRHFGAVIEGLDAPMLTPEHGCEVDVSTKDGRGRFRVTLRAARAADWQRAAGAELAAPSPGMGLLAARCRSAVEVSRMISCPGAELALLGALAFAQLGPVLMYEETAIFGIRGALTRYQAILQKARPD